MSTDLESRIRRIEDRQEISDTVIRYATAIDRADWALFESCLAETVHIDFSEAGMPPADLPRAAFAGFARQGLNGFTARQHLSPNHLVTFDDTDPDVAVCESYMYAQHYLEGASGGDFYLMRGSYTNHMVRTADGWRIARLIQHLSWSEGNLTLPEQAGAANG